MSEAKEAVPAFDYDQVIWGGGDIVSADAKDFLGHSLHLKYALEALREVKGDIVEVGCGSGKFIASVAHARSDLKCHGTDISEPALAEGKRLHQGKVQFEKAGAEKQPFADHSLGAVLMVDVLEHLPEPVSALNEVKRVLAANGVFHLVFPCERHRLALHGWWPTLQKWKRNHAGHIQQLTAGELKDLLAANGFEIRSFYYSYHPLGQLYDAAVFGAMGMGVDMHKARQEKVEKSGTSLLGLVRRGVSYVLYAESSVLKKVPFGMTVHVTAVVKGS